MSQRRECWINVCQIPTHRHYKSILGILILLILGSLAVGFRFYLCQAQAYAIIVITIVGIMTALLHNSQRRDSVVKIKKEVYCADLSAVSHIAVTPGRLSSEVLSSYERLYFTRVRVWIPLIVWLVWVAYGSLFHSGEHSTHPTHELLVDLSNVGEQTPAYVRVARLYLLAVCGVGSLLLTQWYRLREVRETEATIVKMSESEQRWQCRLWLLFTALLFFPASESTAQALIPSKLVARTVFFYVLFVLSESLNRLVHYERWLRCYKLFTQAILVAIQISLGRAEPIKLKENRTRELAASLDNMEPPPPVVEPRKPNSPDLLSSEVVKYCAVLQSAWVLFASEAVYPAALLQVFFILAMHVRVRLNVVLVAKAHAPDFFVVNQDTPPLLPVSSRNNPQNNFVATSAAHEREAKRSRSVPLEPCQPIIPVDTPPTTTTLSEAEIPPTPATAVKRPSAAAVVPPRKLSPSKLATTTTAITTPVPASVQDVSLERGPPATSSTIAATALLPPPLTSMSSTSKKTSPPTLNFPRRKSTPPPAGPSSPATPQTAPVPVSSSEVEEEKPSPRPPPAPPPEMTTTPTTVTKLTATQIRRLAYARMHKTSEELEKELARTSDQGNKDKR